MRNSLRLLLLGSLATLGSLPGAFAQQPAQPASPPVAATPPAATVPGSAVPGPATPGSTATSNSTSDGTAIVDAATLEAGANSFTEGQARSRLERAGLNDVQELRKDDRGFWRGRAMHNGQMAEVAMDFRGRIAAGTNLAALGTGGDAGRSASGSRDGTGSNPPGTAASRGIDSATGSNLSGANPGGARPDGTPGNPPGTAASRAIDSATGSNMSGANPPPAGTKQ